ncbi:hypothetical protein X953_11810 [Virgibacillus sp. SK37]|nr:FapA family protein [Virgibacillus sp. SK37]AIF45463.1 hypothetical protein X953_11810 [Virgibacillus sp. SK37]
MYVENSILHSDITAREQIFCQRGHIIGGRIIGGASIEVRDAGNRMNTKTEIVLGLNYLLEEKKQQLFNTKQELNEKKEKLLILGNELKARGYTNNPKIRIMELKQKNSLLIVNKQLEDINQLLLEIGFEEDKNREASLVVRNNLYANVTVAFGKYQRTIDANQHYVKVSLKDNEVNILPLF